LVKRLVYNGVLMQLTAGSFLGRFGRRPRYWAERMLDEGLCHVLATDAHNIDQRAPQLAETRELIARRIDAAEADKLVLTRPRAIIEDVSAAELPSLPQPAPQAAAPSSWRRIFRRGRAGGAT
jgi:protein-tyrosine phosphatase